MVHCWHDVENEKVTAEGEIQEAAGKKKKQSCDSLQELITSCSGIQSTPVGHWCLHVKMVTVTETCGEWGGLHGLGSAFWIWKEMTDAVKVQTSKFNSRPWTEISLETVFMQSLFLLLSHMTKRRLHVQDVSFLDCSSSWDMNRLKLHHRVCALRPRWLTENTILNMFW